MDALLAVDAASGERVWQVGGRDATRPFAGPYDAFDHAHTSYVDSDTLWVFDNRVIEGGTSRLVRYDLTEDPVRAVWSVPEATGRNIGFLGDFRPGPQGRSFGAWTVPGDVTEHDAQGIEVWRAKLGRGPVLGRIGVVELPR